MLCLFVFLAALAALYLPPSLNGFESSLPHTIVSTQQPQQPQQTQQPQQPQLDLPT